MCVVKYSVICAAMAAAIFTISPHRSGHTYNSDKQQFLTQYLTVSRDFGLQTIVMLWCMDYGLEFLGIWDGSYLQHVRRSKVASIWLNFEILELSDVPVIVRVSKFDLGV
jgi:hypothetical protein